MASSTDDASCKTPPLQIILQERERLQVLNVLTNGAQLPTLEGTGELLDVGNLRINPVYSPDGMTLCCVFEGKRNCTLYNTESGGVRAEIELFDIQKAEFSPKGSFLVTWSHPSKGGGGEGGNLRIWLVSTGSLIAAFSQKIYKQILLLDPKLY